ncbi:SGNH hydrolase [Durotheca rogersii]|uniref:SGNH hydrolase n=1 Tax=Durotheca rogersii TaxID=419775 RepID=UPI002220E424|nr:SGNH hydrolase [Durotheca rogersii]KAI5867026.1 SGNH hydrolase [Durotheca rogersii]
MSTPRRLHIASMGSSFAAGPSIAPVENEAAGRSAANYAHLVAQRIGAASAAAAAAAAAVDVQLTDIAVSGATLPNLMTEPQDRGGGHVFPPQMESLPPDADVVLVLGGGNDIGYIGGLFADTLDASWVGALVRRFWGTGGAPLADPPATPAARAAQDDWLAARYADVLDRVRARAPRARVLVVEYLTMLGPDVRPGADVPFAADRVAHHRDVAARLLAATARAVEGRQDWCHLVPAAAASEPHAIGSPRPWVSAFTWQLYRAGGAYHPRAEGMAAVADLVYRKLVELGIVEDDGNGDSEL